MQMRQLRYGRDNFSYLLCGDKRAIAVDGGAVQGIIEVLADNDLVLDAVVNTHGHGDHTCGNNELLRASGAMLQEYNFLKAMGKLDLDGETIEVIETPGHSTDSLCFLAGGCLISGDTLFNGTVGNCFSGDMEGFFRSIKKLMRLPKETKVYAGHDYVGDSLAFARKLEPDNRAIDAYLQKYNPAHVVSTLADEFAVNPFLRFNEQPIIDLLAARKMKRATEFERWASLMWIE